jgi:hypothetical protein
VLGGGRQVTADGAELPGAGEGAQAADIFCFSLVMRMSRSQPLFDSIVECT